MEQTDKADWAAANPETLAQKQQSLAGASDLSAAVKDIPLSASATSSPSPSLNNGPFTPSRNMPSRPGTAQRRHSRELLPAAHSPRLMRKSSRSSIGGPAEDGEKRPTPKRSISNLIAGLREAQGMMEPIKEPVVLTAADIASNHFAGELERHDSAEAETVVILHDACYGHRYSRPKTTKSTLSMIVERPERIHAGVLGAATAYIRLGGHHEGARNAPHPERTPETAPPFKIRRTARSMDVTNPCVTAVHGTAWMSELHGLCDAAGDRLAKGENELARATNPTEPEKRKLHQGDLYLASESLYAFQGALGGVAEAVDTVFTSPANGTKRAFVAIRPPGHHCSADYPSGFCWLNNVHVGLEYAAETHGLTHAAIIDFDLHHGDGSQAIAWERNKSNQDKRWNATRPHNKLKLGPDIGYFSLHDINSYPCEVGDDDKVQAASLCVENAHGQTVWNVHLQPWKDLDEFWQAYESRYKILLDKARAFLRHHASQRKDAKAAVFVSAGFDASEWEGAGMQRHKVNVPTEFYARLTREIRHLAEEPGSGCEGRVISVLEGGYSDRALCSGVLSHLSGLCASPLNSNGPGLPNGQAMAHDLDRALRGMSLTATSAKQHFTYNKEWWSPPYLTALENKVNPPPPPSAPGKKVRAGPQPTYATPTESFAYKVVDPNKFARSISGTLREGVPVPARPSPPPAPSVDWVVAVQELAKLLIPADRQTKSCTVEELAGPKPEKKVRQSAMDLGVSTEYAMKLRETRSTRRLTVQDLPLASAPALEPQGKGRVSRRSSMASTVSSSQTEVVERPPVPPLPRVGSVVEGIMQPPPPPPPPPPPVPRQVGVGVQVKKTRVPPKVLATKKVAAPASAPVSPAAKQQSPTALPQASNVRPATSVGNGGIADDGLDALTNGLKKITLKAGTKEEHEKKEKERRDLANKARAVKAAETRRVNAANRKAAAAAAAGGNSHGVAASAKSAVLSTSIPAEGGVVGQDDLPLPHAESSAQPMVLPPGEIEGSNDHMPELSESTVGSAPQAAPNLLASKAAQSSMQEGAVPLTTVSLETTLDHNAQVPQHKPLVRSTTEIAKAPSDGLDAVMQSTSAVATSADQYAPTRPSDSTINALIHRSEIPNGTLPQSLPPSSAQIQPSPRNSKALPIWTSTGYIPFAPPKETEAVLGTGSPPSPKSPWRKQHRPSTSLDNGNGVSRTMLDGGEDAAEASTPPIVGVKRDEEDIWAVPETPARR